MGGIMGQPETTARVGIDDLPVELLMEILSRLSWRQQLLVRSVSRRWQVTVDACLARRRELYINTTDAMNGVNTERLLNLLQSMPALRRLFCSTLFDTEWDRESMARLCTSCPQFQEVSMSSVDEAGVDELLRHLPDLQLLHLFSSPGRGDYLCLLPAGMRSLSLTNSLTLVTANLRHLRRCPQLTELDLSWTKVCGEELVAVLAACPRLERLAVAGCRLPGRRWLRELTRRPQLRELDMSYTDFDHDDYEIAALDSGLSDAQLRSDTLIACGRLERLRLAWVEDPLSIIRAMSLPNLTHLDLSNTQIDDTAFCELFDLLPGLRDLRLSRCTNLTSRGLVAALPRLSNLQVLDITYTEINFTDDVISSLSGLPLKALACDCPGDRLLKVIQRCPALAVLYITEADVTSWMSGLTRHPVPKHRDITLIIQEFAMEPERVADLASRLPGNIRLRTGTKNFWAGAVRLGRARQQSCPTFHALNV